jgi:PAS domain S-box-containing protein
MRTRALTNVNETLRSEIAAREPAAGVVKQAEDRLRLVLDATPALIDTCRPDGYLDYFNQRWLKYVGLSLEELQGWAWTAVIHPEDVEGLVEKWRASLASGEPFEAEARVRSGDGVYRWMLHRKVPLRDEDGNIVKWYGTSTDIEDLKRAEDRVRLVINTIPTMAWTVRPDGAVDFVNQRWLDYSGLSLEEEIENPTRAIHPEDLPRVMEKWLANMAAGEPYEDEMRLRRADGEYRWFLVRTAPLSDDQGNLAKWYGSSIDIEDRRRAEHDLRRQKEILQTIFDNVPAMIGFVGPDGKIKLANREWERTLGWTLEEVLRQDLDVFAEMYPDYKYRQEVLNFVFESNAEWADFRTRVRDGQVIDTTWANVHLADGTTIGIGRDITERKRAERESRALIDAIPQQIWSGPPGGTLDYCNDRWRSYTGLELQDLRGDGWQTMLHPDDRDRVLNAWRESVVNGTPFEQEERHRGADGRYRWFLARGVPLRDEEGRIVRWYGTNTDIEDRKQAEEELRYVSGLLLRLQDEERHRIARDLHDSTGQDLVALATMLGQLRGSIPSGDRKSRKLLSESKAVADRCIREVRTLSYSLHPPVLDQAGLGDAIRDYLSGFTKRSGIRVELDLSPRLGRMARDVELVLFRVVRESLTNIQRHSGSQQAKIRVTLNSHLTLEISDFGRGLSASVQKGKDEPRFQVGVGIPSMHERVKLIGGWLDIDSSSRGTTVRVTIPLGRERT